MITKQTGPGRPKLGPDKRQPLTIRISPDLAAWLDSQPGRRGRIVEDALREYRASHGQRSEVR